MSQPTAETQEFHAFASDTQIAPVTQILTAQAPVEHVTQETAIPFGELLGRDYDNLARLARSDENIARMLAIHPGLIHPAHIYTRNGSALAMATAITVLRPLAVREITTERGHLTTFDRLRIDALYVEIPMHTRSLTLVSPLADMLGDAGNGSWTFSDAISDAIAGRIA